MILWNHVIKMEVGWVPAGVQKPIRAKKSQSCERKFLKQKKDILIIM